MYNQTFQQQTKYYNITGCLKLNINIIKLENKMFIFF